MEPKDTPTIDEVVGQAMDAAEQPTEPLQDTEGETTKPETSEAEISEQKQPEEESFTSFRPQDLPPELQQVYKRWQADYTQKRQTEKAELKRLQEENESLKQRAPQSATSDQIRQSYEQDMRSGQIDPTMTLVEYTNALEERIMNRVKTSQENNYIESQEKAFYQLDPRFDEDSPDFDPILFNYVAGETSKRRDAFEKENGTVLGFDFLGTGKGFIETYEERLGALNKAFVAKQGEMAKAKAQKFAQASPKGVSSAKGKATDKMDFDDAFEAAVEATGAEF